MLSAEELGRVGYEAYGDHAEWKAFDGRPMPRWDDLRADIKEKWAVAALAIQNELAGLTARDKNGKKYTKGQRVRLVTGLEGVITDSPLLTVLLDGDPEPKHLMVPERHEILP
jgi:hypothetical protein